MCVLVLAHRADARWPLVLAANRDERHDRPSAPLAAWPDAPGVIAGRDLEAGGTWLGVSEAGRLTTVTNVRSGLPPDPARPSRGALVAGLLAGGGAPDPAALAAYAPFILLHVSGRDAGLWTNAPEVRVRALTPGLHGFANNPLDQPSDRARRLQGSMSAWLASGSDSLAPLFAALADEAPGAGSRPIFLRSPVYGTRCSTLVRVAADGAAEIVERRFTPEGEAAGETALAFRWG